MLLPVRERVASAGLEEFLVEAVRYHDYLLAIDTKQPRRAERAALAGRR
jgi:hypothetical protein